MKLRIRDIIRKTIAVVLIVALLPFSDIQNCLSVKAQEPGTSDGSEEFTESESGQTGAMFAAQSDTGEENLTLTGDYTLTQDKVVDRLVLTDGILDLNGYSLTVEGDLIQTGGVLFVNGGTLTVEGDYLLQSEEAACSTGLLRMTEEEDRVCVLGDFISETDQDSTDVLTAGVLEVRGDVLVHDTCSRKSFVASGEHTLLLNGEGLQIVNLDRKSTRLNSSHM